MEKFSVEMIKKGETGYHVIRNWRAREIPEYVERINVATKAREGEEREKMVAETNRERRTNVRIWGDLGRRGSGTREGKREKREVSPEK